MGKKPNKYVALFDLDGTLADLDRQLADDMNRIKGPDEPDFVAALPGQKSPPHIKARKIMIFNQPDWWEQLPRYQPGWDVLEMVRQAGLQVQIASKPSMDCHDSAAQKLRWVERHLGKVVTHLSGDKGMIQADLLVDDWVQYVARWLELNPQGRAILPLHSWNQDFRHDRAIHYDGTNADQVRAWIQGLGKPD